MASSLIESMASDFKPEEFTDDYRAALQQIIDAKVNGKEVVAPPEIEEAPSGAIDLMAALRASVERAKAAREAGGAEQPEIEHEPVTPTPISAAKSAKKTAKKAAPAKATTHAAADPDAGSDSATDHATPARKTATKRAPAKKATTRAEPAQEAPAKKATKRAPAKRRSA